MEVGNTQTGRIITLEAINKAVDNVNLDSDIVVWDQRLPISLPTDKAITFPARIDAMLIVICRHGSGSVAIDLNEYEVKENTLMVIHPQHFLGTNNFEEGTEFNIVACSRRVVEEVLPKLTDLLPLLLYYRRQPVVHLSPIEAEGIKAFYDLIRQKLEMPVTPFRRQKVLCMLQAALFEMMDLNSVPEREKPKSKSRREELMARFILAIGQHYRNHREVSFYSDALCISPKHLSTVVKAVSGRTPGDWIESYVIMEAKMLLITTDLSIQEISSRLHFPNQSFFGKYFKHQTGMSPSAFRKNSNT